MAKKRVAILGGGMAGLTTAWQLTKDPNWKDQLESVTIYQMGWRPGGKCATGRGLFSRVEEHGIHLFGGGYYNALPMMRDVYRALFGESGDARFADAFQNQYTSVSVEGNQKSASQLRPSPLTLDNLHNIVDFGAWLALVIETLRKAFHDPAPAPTISMLVRYVNASTFDLPGTVTTQHEKVAPWLQDVDLLAKQVRKGSNEVPATLDRLRAVADPASIGLIIHPQLLDGQNRYQCSTLEMGVVSRVSRWFSLLDFIVALTTGWWEDIFLGRRSFTSLDDLDFAQWLRSHGARDSTLELDIVQAPIRILYQYAGGDSSAAGNRSMGAGAYLHWTLRSFAYMCSPFWFFKHGTGDTVIAPLYEVLVRRGVRFEFFRKVEKLSLSSDGSRIESATVRIQATTLSGQPYQPLEAGKWPTAPRYSDLVEGDELKGLPAGELESYWSRYRESKTTEIVADKDFDAIVFAISLGAVPFLCEELLQRQPKWRCLVDKVKTIETQSLQIWMDRDSQALGISDDLYGTIQINDTGLGAGFAKPFDGFSDFSDLLSEESWPEDRRPKALWYFSDILKSKFDAPDLNDPGYPQARGDAVFAHAKRFLENDLGRLLSAFSPQRGGFDFRRLVVPNLARATNDDERLGQQFIRANVQPSDRYVQALAGTTQYRLDAGRSEHFANLYLAGDWTYNGLNVGCVEAAVMSGMLAGNDLLGRTHAEGLVGYFAR